MEAIDREWRRRLIEGMGTAPGLSIAAGTGIIGGGTLAAIANALSQPSPTNPYEDPEVVDPLIAAALGGVAAPAISYGVYQLLKGRDMQAKSMAVSSDPINVWYGTGENVQFSNLQRRPFIINGRQYNSVEHAYQTLKSGSFDDLTYAAYNAPNAPPKIIGKRKAKTDGNWNLELMHDLIYESMRQNPEIAQQLVATGSAPITHLQEQSIWRDAFPQALMRVRDELRGRDSLLSEVPDLRVISGGQTGADYGGLLAAEILGIPTGGLTPSGWKTEDGSNPNLARFGLQQDSSTSYVPRTHKNAAAADVTLWFGNTDSPGYACTSAGCVKAGKPLVVIDENTSPDMVRDLILSKGYKTINVAGNRESKNPGLQAKTRDFLLEALGTSAPIEPRHITGNITSLQPNQIFVFGSNTEGKHGAGAAKDAFQKFGAEYYNPRGLQGQSYAIVTKDLKQGERSIPLEQIASQLEELAQTAKGMPDKEFLLTPIGAGRGGYSVNEVRGAIQKIRFPRNVVFVNW